MSIEFGCRECRKLLRVPESSAGKKARCPACGTIQEVPSAGLPAGETESASVVPGPFAAPRAAADSPLVAAPVAANPFADGAAPEAANRFQDNQTNPYAAPTSGTAAVRPHASGPGAEAWARDCVQGPATALVAVAGFILAFSAIGLAINLSSLIVDGNLESSAIRVGSTAVIAIPYAIAVYGGLQMKQLQNYALAVAASILIMLPCSGCCVLGLPVGIWSLVVLCNPTIRNAFH